MRSESSAKRQFGDYQTDIALVTRIASVLRRTGNRWSRVLEPTCGKGSFIQASAELAPDAVEIIGIDRNPLYTAAAERIPLPRSLHRTILQADLFRLDLRTDLHWQSNGPLLVVGNPPWVTSAEIGSLNGTNLPRKSNFKKMRGMDALTGKSNFDIAEFIWIKLITELAAQKAHIALLCKTSVARNVLQYCRDAMLPICDASMHLIDAGKWFGIFAEACLFTLTTGCKSSSYDADVFSSLEATEPEHRIGFRGSHLIRDLDSYEQVAFLEGSSPLEWRQGVKHDAASVMELKRIDRSWVNGHGLLVDIEDEYVCPLIKGSDVRRLGTPECPQRAVVIPQRYRGEDTEHLMSSAPKLWQYLLDHARILDGRRSSIYRNRPRFSIFGIGPYSFAPWKIVISGLHKEPLFSVAGPIDGKPALCDDTCYLAPFESSEAAYSTAELLNHPTTSQFLKSITFNGSKRPFTKSVLDRLNITNLQAG